MQSEHLMIPNLEILREMVQRHEGTQVWGMMFESDHLSGFCGMVFSGRF